ncbi:FAD-dependent oxidoreductase [Shimia sp. MMG029]|uniref:FAD-dependent oxidoreductase n=1 Tax=Shimia sp. MMG029 TaxID=3021978 RepID=UPI0022FEA7C4|nr:FAD-dependent oxidoreductase [Shimia sp. MMG029]MDA5558139.1 FAD-dependent oxidoreductase [Shimia sp. MMG029]
MKSEGTDDGDQILILGGGIAGLAAANALSSAGRKVLVIEASDQLGGMHASRDIGPYTFDLGSIFYEDTASLLNLAPGLRDLCQQKKRTQRRILPDGTLRHYPIEPKDILRWPIGKLMRAGFSMAWARLFKRLDGSLQGICAARLGPVLFRETGLRDYTVHFNRLPPEEIAEAFYHERMKFVHQATEVRRVFRSAWRALLGRPFRAKPRAPLYYRPRSGYGTLFERIENVLRARGVAFVMGAEVTRIVQDGDGAIVETSAGPFSGTGVVGAMSIDALHEACFGERSGLESLDLLSLFVSAETLSDEAGDVLFNFHSGGGWKRATIYSRLYPDAGVTREYFTVEVTVPRDEVPDAQDAFDRFREHLSDLGIATGLRLEGSHVSAGAYPLLLRGKGAQAQTVINRLQDAGVHLVGRQGRFEYLPTSSKVIARTDEELENSGL